MAIKRFVILIFAVLALGWPAPALAATRFEVGISTSASLLNMDQHKLNTRLADMHDLGAKWVRVDFSWPIIQPDSPDHYKWKQYDAIVEAAGNHDIKVLAVLAYTPEWAQEPRCARLVITKAAGKKCNPKSVDDFARFARAAAIRYKNTNLRGWEIWNEPNLSSYWKTTQANGYAVHFDPQAYAKFANAAAEQIRLHDPDGVIVTGGLAPMFEPKYPKGMRQSDYLAQLLPLLHRDWFDAVGIHPYSWPVLPEKPEIYNAFYTVDNGNLQYNLRVILSSAGWGDKELWGTEYGASTKGLRKMGIPLALGRPDHVTEDSQAQIVEQGIASWYKKANVGPLFVHSDSDQWLISRRNEAGFGLRRSDGSKKPSYDAFWRSARRVQGRVP